MTQLCIVGTLFERFGPMKLSKGHMFFEYGGLYHIVEICEDFLAYTQNWDRPYDVGRLRPGQGYVIGSITARRTITGTKIVFSIEHS